MKTFSSISLRLLAVILCLALIVVTLPQVLFSKAGEVFGLNEPESRVTEENEMTAFVLGEMADERTARTKTFRMSNGSFLLANYAEPVHFVDAGGKWMDYDNTLKYIETESSSSYENTASDVQMRFSVCPEGGEAWLGRSIRSGTEDITTTSRQGSIICRRDIMIRRSGDS